MQSLWLEHVQDSPNVCPRMSLVYQYNLANTKLSVALLGDWFHFIQNEGHAKGPALSPISLCA